MRRGIALALLAALVIPFPAAGQAKPDFSGTWTLDGPPDPTTTWKICENLDSPAGCNWLLPAEEEETLCRSCRLDRTIPDLEDANNALWWRKIENAKRRLGGVVSVQQRPRPSIKIGPALEFGPLDLESVIIETQPRRERVNAARLIGHPRYVVRFRRIQAAVEARVGRTTQRE